ncbi:MAG TPA: putative molybdenum carrier protein, partial [Bacteroidales bacterium]|nr:putative molybdenum carrier protein [Bacteroidales bacterium]
KNKKILIIDLNNHIYNNINDFLKWVKTYNLKNINIAGNRESNNQGIYQKTYEFLKECLNLIH